MYIHHNYIWQRHTYKVLLAAGEIHKNKFLFVFLLLYNSILYLIVNVLCYNTNIKFKAALHKICFSYHFFPYLCRT